MNIDVEPIELRYFRKESNISLIWILGPKKLSLIEDNTL